MKTIKLVFIFLMAISISLGTFSVSVKEVSAADSAQTDADLNSDAAGILPTNPFYFMKQFGWNLRRFLTFDPVQKLDLELKIIDQKIAEIKKLQDINLDTDESLNKAVVNYEENLDQLKAKLESIKTDTSTNPNLESVLNTLMERGLKHKEIFSNLKEKRHASIKSILDGAIVRINALLEEVSKIKAASSVGGES